MHGVSIWVYKGGEQMIIDIYFLLKLIGLVVGATFAICWLSFCLWVWWKNR